MSVCMSVCTSVCLLQLLVEFEFFWIFVFSVNDSEQGWHTIYFSALSAMSTLQILHRLSTDVFSGQKIVLFCTCARHLATWLTRASAQRDVTWLARDVAPHIRLLGVCLLSVSEHVHLVTEQPHWFRLRDIVNGSCTAILFLLFDDISESDLAVKVTCRDLATSSESVTHLSADLVLYLCFVSLFVCWSMIVSYSSLTDVALFVTSFGLVFCFCLFFCLSVCLSCAICSTWWSVWSASDVSIVSDRLFLRYFLLKRTIVLFLESHF